MIWHWKRKRVVFVHRINPENTGDMACCPFLYYRRFFKRFKTRFIDIGDTAGIESIQPDDTVIIGGGGLLDTLPEWNRNINILLNKCDTVIGWSLGFNSHYGDQSVKEAIDFPKFKLIGIRDYNHPSGLPWLPCVTCKIPLLNKRGKIKRKIGVANHVNFPLDSEYESVHNMMSLREIIRFISASEEIITSTYHCALWAMYMGKRVVLRNTFSPKFEYFKEPAILREARDLNDQFFEKVKKVCL